MLGEKEESLQKRRLLIGGVSLIRGRLRNSGMAMVRVCDSLEPLMSAWLADAPFHTISLIVRYGTSTTAEVEIGRIDKRHSELPVAVQVALSDLQDVQSDETQLDEIFCSHTLRALEGVGLRYSLGRFPQDTTIR